MQVLLLEIYGFRGIRSSRLTFSERVVLLGPNGVGKSTIVDALSLIFDRQKLVKELTEHDFTASSPNPADRIRIIATLGGFPENDPEKNADWFGLGRAVEKWWSPEAKTVEPEKTSKHSILVAQIGFAARFDQEDLEVKQIRYFHDDDDALDPFVEEGTLKFPDRLLKSIGFFVLPSQRNWGSTLSFSSEIFRKAVESFGGVPATAVLSQLEKLRSPEVKLEEDPELEPLVRRINERMSQLVLGNPKFQLRITSTDSKGLLRALVPHFEQDGFESLPAARHGTGLISLQTLVLLLEIGQERRRKGQSFILALEEPELHIPPGLQRRLIGDAVSVANQLICTTHAPRLAAYFEASQIQILMPDERSVRNLAGKLLIPESMINDRNPLIQLFTDHRISLIEALLFPAVLIPEGRIDYEWLRHLLDIAETGIQPIARVRSPIPPFGATVGVVPTRDSHVQLTCERLMLLHANVVVLVDGDRAGDQYATELLECAQPPAAIIQWPKNWAIEDVVVWAIGAEQGQLLLRINERIERNFQTLEELLCALKDSKAQNGGLKSHYIAHEEIACVMKRSREVVARVEIVLESISRAVLNRLDESSSHMTLDGDRSREQVRFYRFSE